MEVLALIETPLRGGSFLDGWVGWVTHFDVLDMVLVELFGSNCVVEAVGRAHVVRPDYIDRYLIDDFILTTVSVESSIAKEPDTAI